MKKLALILLFSVLKAPLSLADSVIKIDIKVSWFSEFEDSPTPEDMKAFIKEGWSPVIEEGAPEFNPEEDDFSDVDWKRTIEISKADLAKAKSYCLGAFCLNYSPQSERTQQSLELDFSTGDNNVRSQFQFPKDNEGALLPLKAVKLSANGNDNSSFSVSSEVEITVKKIENE